ncbi:MAG: hypothetical protein ACKPE1_04425 [Dolichospermum sp.]
MTREQGKGNRGRGTVEVVELLPITSLNRYDIALSGVMKYISSGQDARTTRVS